MNLTYEIINDSKGYLIKNNNVNWIKQDSYIPYPGATIEESAQNHINELIKQSQESVPTTDFEQLLAERDAQIKLLKEQQLRTDADLAAFMDFVLSGGM